MKNTGKFLILSIIASVGAIMVGGEGSNTTYSKAEILHRHNKVIMAATKLDLNSTAEIKLFKDAVYRDVYIGMPFRNCPKLEFNKRKQAGYLHPDNNVYYVHNCAGALYPYLEEHELGKLMQLQDKQ